MRWCTALGMEFTATGIVPDFHRVPFSSVGRRVRLREPYVDYKGGIFPATESFGGGKLSTFYHHLVAGPLPQSPAPGYRHASSGSPVNVGLSGYSWASTVNGADGMRLNFNVAWLYPSTTAGHAYGFQLRCLSE